MAARIVGRKTVAHRAVGTVIAVSDAGYIVAETAALSPRMMVSVVVVAMMVPVIVVVVGVMPVIVVVAPTIGPVRIPAPVRVVIRIPPIVVPTPAPVAAPVRTVSPTNVEAWVIIPIEWVISVGVNIIGVAASTGVVIVVIAS